MKKSLFLAFVLLVAIAAPAFSLAQSYATTQTACMSHAKSQCVSNIAYWYNSCGALESVNQNCNTTKQVCQDGQCVTPNTNGGGTTGGQDNYTQLYSKVCYNNNVYWQDSKGTLQTMFKNCADTNSCTLDSCNGETCTNTLKCDGSTCAQNSADYTTYCTTSNQNQGSGSNGQTQQMGGLSVAMFAGKENQGTQFSNSLAIGQDETLNFILAIKNASGASMNNATVTVNLPATVSYTGNLTLNGTLLAGSITSGVNIGTLAPNTSTALAFTALSHWQSNNATTQITAQITSDGTTASDTVTIASQAKSDTTAAVSESPIFDFIKKWYLWGIIGLVMAALFIIIFRRLSASV